METKWERRSCEACQSEFEPVREAQAYCSPRCRNSAKVRRHGSAVFNPHGPTRGALQADDYPLTYDANGYPELTACLDRRPKPALSEAA